VEKKAAAIHCLEHNGKHFFYNVNQFTTEASFDYKIIVVSRKSEWGGKFDSSSRGHVYLVDKHDYFS